MGFAASAPLAAGAVGTAINPLVAAALITGTAMVGSSLLGRKGVEAQAPAIQSRPVMIQSPYQSSELPYKSLAMPQMAGGGLSSKLMTSDVGSLSSGRGK